jgi:RraA family protein
MRIPSPATADVSDLAGGEVAMDARIRAMWRGARLAGPAFTVQTPPGEHPAVQRALDAAAPGEVIVIDGGAFIGRALWGDKMSSRASERGIAGLVVDGAVRDVAEVERLAFPVFAIASVPTGPRTDHDGELGGAITCGGRRVEPGDLVVGDDDGVVVVPRAVAVELMRRLAEATTAA